MWTKLVLLMPEYQITGVNWCWIFICRRSQIFIAWWNEKSPYFNLNRNFHNSFFFTMKFKLTHIFMYFFINIKLKNICSKKFLIVSLCLHQVYRSSTSFSLNRCFFNVYVNFTYIRYLQIKIYRAVSMVSEQPWYLPSSFFFPSNSILQQYIK